MIGPLSGSRKTIRVYDFRRPDKFSKEQIRALHMVYDSFTRSLTTALSAQLRIAVEVSVSDVEQLTFAEFLERLEEPCVLALISVAPLNGTAVMELDAGLVFPIIDRMFGGSGQPAGGSRPLTDIEEAIIRRVINAILGALKEAWADLIQLEPSLRSVESNPMFAQVVAPGEMCANTVFELDLGSHKGRLQLCMPHLVLEPVMPKLSTHRWYLGDGKQHDAGSTVELDQVVVDLWVRLGTARLKFSELMGLQPGKVLILDRKHDDEVDLFVGDRPKFRVLPGKRGQRLAVQVTGVINENDGGELR